MTEAHIAQARKNYHADLLRSVLTINKNGVPTNADKDSKLSVRIAQGIAEQLESTTGERLAGQTSGSEFELINAQFLTNTFMRLEHMRPGKWEIKRIGNRNRMAIAAFEQYEHLIALERAAKYDPGLAAALGSDYTITPDVIIIQHLLSDGEINSPFPVVDDTVSRHAAIRESNGGNPLLHASISSKWTIRSDRSQNSRSEALNLIRNRKGHLPHIVVVTAEPLPSRLASIALGTGDIDCVYHFALHELKASVEAANADDALEMLNIMVDGKRLKDISDLPLDLTL
ncbi:NgoMIV family type II restriction endonuclease [Ferroacidibacillus organovorans]|uniref:Restriction endonuclease n=1 Tax=Ferroacidibacillus organovorans TaxID=1765683 RepID=A0A853K9U0_9BACL|nr:NgoMIV family type II restriction endonuclease [Ferroacidibacillus organovorans]KYP80109.1 restriction endonuclease [Ferroacidibacillus organovorans]OAG93177.1 restriction endonuclease [Ferroacidibacillus organovorans]